MRLRELRIERLPGIRDGFALDDLAPGINVVVGPNASGKTSLLRALRAALYPEEPGDERISVSAAFDDGGGGALEAVRLGREVRWYREGQQVAPPLLPEHRFLSCYALRIEDLLDAAHETDADIAGRLALELAGGYDLRAVREAPAFSLKQTHARGEAVELEQAERELRSERRRREALGRGEARLDHLRRERDAARSAEREAAAHDRALDLLAARRERRRLEERGAQFPQGMDRLRGDERNVLADLRQTMRGHEDARRRTAEALARAEADLAQSALAEAELDEGVLNDRRRHVSRLQGLETELERKRGELTEAEASRAAAVAALGGEPGRPLALDPSTVHRVERELEGKRRLDAELARLEQERDRLPQARDPDVDAERLREGRRALLRWLAAPQVPGSTPGRLAAAAAALLAGGGGIILGALLLHGVVAALLLPLAWGIYVLTRSVAGPARRDAEARYAETGLDAPAAWTPQAAHERLDDLDGRIQQAERQVRMRERRAEVERELETRQEQLEPILAHLREVATEVGHDPGELDASLQRWIRLTADYDQARERVAQVRAEHDRRAADAAALRGELTDFLQGYGEAPGTDEPDAGTLADRLERLRRRLRQRDAALRDIEQAGRDGARLDSEMEDVQRRITALFERCGLDPEDETGLYGRLELLEEWRELDRGLRGARAVESDHERRLAGRDDLLARVEADDEEALVRGRDALREQAGQLEGLIEEIAGIETEIDRAGRERALEAARARVQQTRDALAERLDEALFAEAGSFLLERVEAEHEQTAQPPALQQAREWFARFTRHAYELIFTQADGHSRFAARETTTGERRGLAELSSGTRMQLLLAARIAFALQAERGRTALPLVLDEALTTADPQRFRAVAESLAVLAEEAGRQIFYLTAQPDDAAYWAARDEDVGAAVHRIDLAALRGRQGAITDPAGLALPEPPAVPDPARHTPEGYAVVLGVPAVDPWAEGGAVHLYYLLRDDLELLRRLLQAGVDRIGPLESLLDAEAAQALLSEAEQRRLRARIAGARAWLEAWRQGRGRPVGREALEASGAVSGTFIERVADLARELEGEPEALLAALAEGRVSGFQTRKREELRGWLQENGYLAEREPLSPTEVQHRVLAAIRLWHERADAALDEARLLAGSLTSGIQVR